jgi:RHS repeat-associated protein
VNVEVFYVHPDHLGTPRVITASTALAATTGTGITSPQTVNKAVWRWDSDPFGSNATANSAPNENPNTLSQVVGTATLPYLFGFDLAFPGQKRDRESGKHYNYFRDYDPGVGRYVESDPIGLAGGANTFAYVRNPIADQDRYGLMGNGGTGGRSSRYCGSKKTLGCIADDRCKTPFATCMDKCISYLNPWWTTPLGVGIGLGAGRVWPQGAVGACFNGLAQVSLAWQGGTSVGCFIACGNDNCAYDGVQ